MLEYDFHGGSRRQEAQRVDRLMHPDAKGEHILMMKEDEFEKHSKRPTDAYRLGYAGHRKDGLLQLDGVRNVSTGTDSLNTISGTRV